MNRVHFCSVAAVLLLSSVAGASLIVHEYVPDQKVTLDTTTGKHWYWDIATFVGSTYDQQILAIEGLGTYGNIAGGWRMATYADIEELWAYDGWDLLASFNQTWATPMTAGGFLGRYDNAASTDSHYLLSVSLSILMPEPFKSALPGSEFLDSYLLYPGPDQGLPVGAFVVSDAAVVPAPGALVLGVIGVLSSLRSARRLRRRS